METEAARAIIEVAMTGFILSSCAVSLFRSARAIRLAQSGKSMDSAKSELGRLQASIRSMIDEAKNAGLGLNEDLIKRKIELESLLRAPLNSKGIPSSAEDKNSFEESLPNETWHLGYRNSRHPQQGRTSSKEDMRQSSGSKLERSHEKEISVVEERLSRVGHANEKASSYELSYDNSPPLTRAQDTDRELDLKRVRIDIRKFLRQDMHEDRSVARRIAYRLLKGGEEIHIVARKLEMQLEDIRSLDRLVRRESTIENQMANFAGNPQLSRPFESQGRAEENGYDVSSIPTHGLRVIGG